HTDRLNDYSAVCPDFLHGFFDIIHHDMHKDSGFGIWYSICSPGTTDASYTIVEGNGSVAASPDFPLKNLMIKGTRLSYIAGRQLHVTYFTVAKCGLCVIAHHDRLRFRSEDLDQIAVLQHENFLHGLSEHAGNLQRQDRGRNVFITFYGINRLPGYTDLPSEFGLRNILNGALHADIVFHKFFSSGLA